MLRLPQVTLLVADNVNPDLVEMMMDDCLKACEFGDVLLFAHKDIHYSKKRWVPWTAASGKTWSELIWTVAPHYIETRHALIVHWDAGIINPARWTDEFLEYDYIGAPWWYTDGRNVGNGGFSLRSRRLMQYLHKARLPVVDPEDDVLCRGYRRALEAQGFRWAPEHLAFRFAQECVPAPDGTAPFGFHAMRNWVGVYKGDALRRRVELAIQSDHVRRTATAADQKDLELLARRLGLETNPAAA